MYTAEWWDTLTPLARREVIDVALACVDDLWSEAFDDASPLDVGSWLARRRQLGELADLAAGDPWGAELVEELRLLDRAAASLYDLAP